MSHYMSSVVWYLAMTSKLLLSCWKCITGVKTGTKLGQGYKVNNKYFEMNHD